MPYLLLKYNASLRPRISSWLAIINREAVCIASKPQQSVYKVTGIGRLVEMAKSIGNERRMVFSQVMIAEIS